MLLVAAPAERRRTVPGCAVVGDGVSAGSSEAAARAATSPVRVIGMLFEASYEIEL
jgi:hypothetical protein